MGVPSPSSSVRLPAWYRAIAVVVGLISIALAFIVLLFPGLALLTLVFLLGFALLVIGIDRVIAGLTGHPFGWVPFVGAGGSTPVTPPSGPAQPPGAH